MKHVLCLQLELEPTHARAMLERAFARGHGLFMKQGGVTPHMAATLLTEVQEAERLHEQLLRDVDEVSQEKHVHWKTGTATSFSWIRQQTWTHPSALPIIPASVTLLGIGNPVFSSGLIIELGGNLHMRLHIHSHRLPSFLVISYSRLSYMFPVAHTYH